MEVIFTCKQCYPIYPPDGADDCVYVLEYQG